MTTTVPTARINEAHEHFQRRRDIVDLQKEVDSTEKLQYTEEDLNAIQIRTYRMVLGKDSEPTFKPCFFMPYKGDLSEEPYNEQLEPSRWKWQQYRKRCFFAPIRVGSEYGSVFRWLQLGSIRRVRERKFTPWLHISVWMSPARICIFGC